ncbi:MAG: hypothetical protein ABJJ37_08480 [Roseibium sp.]
MVAISFDEEFYLRENPDVAEAIARGEFSNAREHFDSVGFQEGRDPSVHFDTSFYLEQNPDVAAAGVNPLDHFNTSGDGEARSPNSFFDAAYYLLQNPDVAAAGLSPFEHFQQFGASESRAPNATIASEIAGGFDETSYLGSNPDIAAAVANGEFQSGYHHWLLNGYTESRAGAQNTSGSPLSTTSTPSDSPADAGNPGGGTSAPDTAVLSGRMLTLNQLTSEATLSTDGLSVTISQPGANSSTFALLDFDQINLNGFSLQMSGATVDQLFPDFNAGQIDIVGFNGGGKLDITGVDFGDIKQTTLNSPNVWLSDQTSPSPTVAGFTFSETDGTKSILPDGVTVNGSVTEAFKAWWDSFDDFYASGPNFYNDFINSKFVYLANDYVEHLSGPGNSAFLDTVKTSGDYSNRQQTLHDNLLGNLGDGAITARFENPTGNTYDWALNGDPRSTAAQGFGDRPLPSGNDNTLVQFENAKAWDAANGVTRSDADIEIVIGTLSDIASDGNTMWAGTGISNDHFRVVRNTDAEIELAIKAKIRGVGDYGDSDRTDLLNESFYDDILVTGGSAPTWNQPGGAGPAENVARWSFDFSVATNIDGSNADAPELADHQFKLVFDVDPTSGTSFVTLALDRTDGSDWLFESAENADVATAMQQLLSGDLSNPYIGDNVGENDSSNPTYVSQNSQNFGFANGNEHLVNAFLGNAYNADLTKNGAVTYWEAESDVGNFVISLQAYSGDGVQLLGSNTIVVDGTPII